MFATPSARSGAANKTSGQPAASQPAASRTAVLVKPDLVATASLMPEDAQIPAHKPCASASGRYYVMDESFLTGCAQVDDQHGQLFDAINGLIEACEQNKGGEELNKSLNFLSDYTVKHFFDEELLLKKHGWTGIDPHHHYHEAFKKTVRDLAHEFIMKGASEELIAGVEKRIGDWLVEHIKGQDFIWAAEMKKKAPEMFATPSARPGAVDKTSGQPAASQPAASQPVEPAVSRQQTAGSDAPPVRPSSTDKAAGPFAVLPSSAAVLPSVKPKRRSTGIPVKLICFSSILLFAAVCITALLGVYNMRKLSLETALTVTENKLKGDMVVLKNRIAETYGALRLENGLLADQNGVSLEDRHEVVDEIARELEICAEIFAASGGGFNRVSTSLSENGRRLDGAMSAENAAFVHLSNGRSYTGGVTAQGRRFIGAYEPISAENRVIGAVFAGVEMSKVYALIDGESKKLVLLMAVSAAVLLAFSILFNFVLLKVLIVSPMRKIGAVLKRVEEGDISCRIGLPPGDEIGDIAACFDQTLENLKRLVLIIRNEAEAVGDTGGELVSRTGKTSEAMNEINAGVRHIQEQVSVQTGSVNTTNNAMEKITENIARLTGKIEIQSESVARSSSAIEQMLASIDSVTRISRTNSENVTRLAEASEVGRTGLQAVAEDMHEIARESEGLLEINAVLENIASQTNLLSMNAAIEAAHAGEAGKGFAVVAGEIRKLAESSGTQSKTISTVLKKIRDSITKISNAAGAVLDNFETIDADVKTVSNQEEQIRNAMEEQNAGSRQILESIEKLNEITRAVKNSSGEMEEGSRAVCAEGKNLEKVTAEIASGMNEMAGRAEEINNEVNHVGAIGRKSSGSIETLQQAISRFAADKYFLWDDSMATGVEKIDEQHRELFATINSLIDAIERGAGNEELKKALDFLLEYTVTHFDDEEAIQKQCGFPGFENHRRLHEAFKKTAAELAGEAANFGTSAALVKEVRRKIGDWLVTHIKGQDLSIGEYIRKRRPAL